MENNNDFFGVDEKYIPKAENNDKENIKKEEKNIYEPENVNVEYTKKDKKRFNVFLIILLVSLPIVIIIAIYIMRLSIIKKRYNNDTIQETVAAKSNLHDIKEKIQVASEIHSSAKDAINESLIQMQNQENEMFNSQFTAYEGEQRGSNVKALINAVTTSNSIQDRIVELKGITDIENVTGQLKYNIKMNYDSEGYVNEIVITEAK